MADSSHISHEPVKRGFSALIVTQFFGAVNDNILKQLLIFMVTSGVWKGRLGDAGEAWIAMLFTLPFIFLSGYAGQFADRNSKRWVCVVLKLVEIPIALVAMAGLWMHSLHVTTAALLLLAVHSTYFGPAKYGMIPEVVMERNLSRANGTINMFTNIAVIMGTLLAGPISDRYFPTRGPDGTLPPALLWLPGVSMIAVAIGGLVAAWRLPRVPARDPGLVYDLNPIGTYVKSAKEMARSPLLMVALAWSFFYLLASTALLILPHYKDILQIDYTQNSFLLGGLGIAIGVGCFTAGMVSGDRIEPRLIPFGALGMFITFLLLGVTTPSYWNVALFLGFAGVSAGFYIVPLQALLQELSPEDERGRFLGTANAMSFLAFTAGAAVEWLATNPGGMAPNRVFLVVAGLSLAGTAYIFWHMRGMLRRTSAVEKSRESG